ncbi:MAG: hypothetical protein ACRDU5_11945 [Mycobacterium sp.]
MKKLVALGAGAVATTSFALVTAAVATSDPDDVSSYNVVGEQYTKAVTILKNMGYKASFGGSFGSDLPQSQCLVDSQKVIESTDASGQMAPKMVLMLDCTQEAADQIAESGPSGGPTVGSNGVTTVTPTPVVPIQGAPGAGTPPPPA